MQKIHNLIVAAVFAAAIVGCESSDSEISGVSTISSSSSSAQTEAAAAPVPAATQQQPAANTQQQPAANTKQQPAEPAQTASAKKSEPAPAPAAQKTEPAPNAEPASSAQTVNSGTATVPDAVPFGAFRWSYGGINGSGAKQTSATIKGLSMSKNGLSFGWGSGKLSSWGLSDDALGAYACLFVQDASGAWVGGKFDWISGSRSSRDFINVYGGYGGWNLSNVPNPCSAAFVVISADKKKRTNVIATTWKR